MSRTQKVYDVDEMMDVMPVPWKDCGGVEAIRYTVTTCEIRNLVMDLLEIIDDTETDARYFGEDDMDVDKFLKNLGRLHTLVETRMRGEAKSVRDKIGF